MEDFLLPETDKLVRSWMQHDASHLRDYLVADVEDPRINLQSILSRHFLLDGSIGEKFSELEAQECQFGAVMNWLLELEKTDSDPFQFAAILHALCHQSDNAEGLLIPSYVTKTFQDLAAFRGSSDVPDYIEGFVEEMRCATEGPGRHEKSLNTFRNAWRQQVAKFQPAACEVKKPSVLEAACGSANDFRFIQAYGFAAFMDYTGFDLCPKNIENARKMFPGIRFQVGNVFEIEAVDQAYDFCLVHDLFEHLSLQAMEVAARELCRVTRTAACIGFFNMDEANQHEVCPIDDYHWNRLSMARIRELFASFGFSARVVHVGTFLRRQIGCEQTHNPNAYSFFLRRLPQ